MVRNIIEDVRPLLNNFEHFEVFVVKREKKKHKEAFKNHQQPHPQQTTTT